jgi:hypothetical protein
MAHIHIGDRNQSRFVRSENYNLSAKSRSAERHELMDIAKITNDDDLWLQIGLALGRACERDDLAPEVSDHFVRDCPHSIFVQVAGEIPRAKFKNWRKRMEALNIAR